MAAFVKRYFHCGLEVAVRILAYMLDSLVRVSRRANESYFVRVLDKWEVWPVWRRRTLFSGAHVRRKPDPVPSASIRARSTNATPSKAAEPRVFSRREPTRTQKRPQYLPMTDSKYGRLLTNYHPFSRNNFKYSFTLFSKFFSSFPHGTCSLSVSHMYLALDGIYHLLWAALPSNPTRKKQPITTSRAWATGLSPSLASCSKELAHARLSRHALKDHNSLSGFSVWALAASLAVTEAILVSFSSSA